MLCSGMKVIVSLIRQMRDEVALEIRPGQQRGVGQERAAGWKDINGYRFKSRKALGVLEEPINK